MGENMKRNGFTWLTLGSVAAMIALGTACSSGGDDDDDDSSGAGKGGSGNSAAGSGNSMAGSGTAGSSTPTGGSGTAGSGTAGSGTAGSGTGGTSPGGPSVCDGKTYVLPVGEAYVDNFETDTRFDGWYSFNDAGMPGFHEGEDNTTKPMRNTSAGALTTTASGHTGATAINSSMAKGFGAGFGFSLVPPLMNCVDVSAFKGISFWMKGTAGKDNTLKFQIVSAVTQPADSMPVGDCASSSAACAFKHPAKTISLTEDWKQVVINFADLAPATAFAPAKVMGFNMITDGPDYSVDIDEVTFFTDAAPTGPVMPETGAGGSGGSGNGGTGGTK